MIKKTKINAAIAELMSHDLIDKDESPQLTKVLEHFQYQMTPLMHEIAGQDGIAKQFIPTSAELITTADELKDPIGDHTHSPVKGIIHRYPDRCLLLPVLICPIYCRFCFRREDVGSYAATLKPQELDNALLYIEKNKSIWEVILSGGDPLILKPKHLNLIIGKLNTIPHVEVIRIHTRVPLVAPERITQQVLDHIQTDKALYIVLHANHAQEFTPQGIKACKQLVEAGIPLLSQTTLLKGVNDNIDTLSSLMRTFIRHRIKPYYLHHPDKAKGTSHFRVPIQKGQALIKQLRGRFSGICQPTYVLDIPGGHGKIPIGSSYLTVKENFYEVEDYQGQAHIYQD